MSQIPPGLLLFDTAIYIRCSRGEDYVWLAEDARVFQRTILTSVVAAELYAGTREAAEKRALDELCRAHRMLGHFSAPSTEVWVEAGILLRRAQRMVGQMDFARHLRDVLIALDAARAGASLVTENVRDFTRWRSVLKRSGKILKLFDPSQMS